MAYKRLTYRFKNSIEIEETHNGRYGAPGEKRLKKKKATPEQIKHQNHLNRVKRIRRKIKANFEENDYFSTLTYKKDLRPPTIEDAIQDFRKFIRIVGREYKKRGCVLKWARSIEVGSKGGVHCHLIVNRIQDTDIILRKAWNSGGIHNVLLYEKGDFKDLADYMAKEQNEENRIRGSNYSCSRNLVTVEPEPDMVKERELDEPIRPRRNYYIDKDSIVEGINPVTGYRYRHYTYIRFHRRN